MYRYAIFISLILLVYCSLFAAPVFFQNRSGTSLSDWYFRSDGQGNAWEVIHRTSYLSGNSLVGEFFIQTVWTGIFWPHARIIPPDSGNPALTCWWVVWEASSIYAWVISLDGSGAYLRFNPVTNQLEWYGYNIWIWRVPLGDKWVGIHCDNMPHNPIRLLTGASSTGTSIGFSSRVKILWNIWGSKTFEAFQDYGSKFDIAHFNKVLQQIRKNVWLLTRNLSWDYLNGIKPVRDALIFQVSWWPPVRVSEIFSTIQRYDVRSLIVIGTDLIIDLDYTWLSWSSSRGIIVLKNDEWYGGDVYITREVWLIQAMIFAEWSLMSGESKTDLYNDTAIKITSLPNRQLYIRGSLASRNTLWGVLSSSIAPVCPYSTTCTLNDVMKYDFNYFRSFVASPSDSTLRSYKDASLDAYSMIIEIDANAMFNPPPGF